MLLMPPVLMMTMLSMDSLAHVTRDTHNTGLTMVIICFIDLSILDTMQAVEISMNAQKEEIPAKTTQSARTPLEASPVVVR